MTSRILNRSIFAFHEPLELLARPGSREGARGCSISPPGAEATGARWAVGAGGKKSRVIGPDYLWRRQMFIGSATERDEREGKNREVFQTVYTWWRLVMYGIWRGYMINVLAPSYFLSYSEWMILLPDIPLIIPHPHSISFCTQPSLNPFLILKPGWYLTSSQPVDQAYSSLCSLCIIMQYISWENILTL